MFVATRNLESQIITDLEKKFVFLSGPRQVGKSTLAKKIIAAKKGLYLLYDDDDDRRRILTRDYLSESWICLDEFHKFPRWKNQIKGTFDKYHPHLHLLLTGSARLDIYQKSGDSLFGRYYLHHLHPLTCGELRSDKVPPLFNINLEPHEEVQSIEPLMKFGGFPEPFASQSEQEHRRWSNTRRALLIREDLRDMSQVQLLGLVEQLMLLLPQRIGSLLSLRSLSEDIRVAPATIQNWLEIFQRLFLLFKITPYSKKIIRSLHRQPKYYLYDWSQITDMGVQFENFIASHLWKAVQIWNDLGEANLALHYIRDRDQREADFLITRENKPWLLIEAKLSETMVSDTLRYFCQRLRTPGLQILLTSGIYKKEGFVTVLSANRFLGFLP